MSEYGMLGLLVDAEANCEFHELIWAEVLSFIAADHILNMYFLSLLTADQNS